MESHHRRQERPGHSHKRELDRGCNPAGQSPSRIRLCPGKFSIRFVSDACNPIRRRILFSDLSNKANYASENYLMVSRRSNASRRERFKTLRTTLPCAKHRRRNRHRDREFIPENPVHKRKATVKKSGNEIKALNFERFTRRQYARKTQKGTTNHLLFCALLCFFAANFPLSAWSRFAYRF